MMELKDPGISSGNDWGGTEIYTISEQAIFSIRRLVFRSILQSLVRGGGWVVCNEPETEKNKHSCRRFHVIHVAYLEVAYTRIEPMHTFRTRKVK